MGQGWLLGDPIFKVPTYPHYGVTKGECHQTATGWALVGLLWRLKFQRCPHNYPYGGALHWFLHWRDNELRANVLGIKVLSEMAIDKWLSYQAMKDQRYSIWGLIDCCKDSQLIQPEEHRFVDWATFSCRLGLQGFTVGSKNSTLDLQCLTVGSKNSTLDLQCLTVGSKNSTLDLQCLTVGSTNSTLDLQCF